MVFSISPAGPTNTDNIYSRLITPSLHYLRLTTDAKIYSYGVTGFTQKLNLLIYEN